MDVRLPRCFFSSIFMRRKMCDPIDVLCFGLWRHIYPDMKFDEKWYNRNNSEPVPLSLFPLWMTAAVLFCSTFAYHKDCFALTTWRLLMCSIFFSFIPPSNVFLPSFLFSAIFPPLFSGDFFFLLFCRDDIFHWWYRWHTKHHMKNTVDHFDAFSRWCIESLSVSENRSSWKACYFQHLCHLFSLNHFPKFSEDCIASEHSLFAWMNEVCRWSWTSISSFFLHFSCPACGMDEHVNRFSYLSTPG